MTKPFMPRLAEEVMAGKKTHNRQPDYGYMVPAPAGRPVSNSIHFDVSPTALPRTSEPRRPVKRDPYDEDNVEYDAWDLMEERPYLDPKDAYAIARQRHAPPRSRLNPGAPDVAASRSRILQQAYPPSPERRDVRRALEGRYQPPMAPGPDMQGVKQHEEARKKMLLALARKLGLLE